MVTCALLVVGYTIFLSSYFTRGLDLSIQFRLEEKALLYKERFGENPSARMSATNRITPYYEYKALPEGIRNTYSEEELPAQAFLPCQDGNMYYRIYAFERQDGKRLYLVFHFREGEMSEQAHRRFDLYYIYMPAIAGISAIALVLVLAFFMFKFIARPVEKLHQWAVGLEPETLDNKAVTLDYDELNQLAELILSTSRRLVAGAEREKKFQQYASHELRTPIAILQNNLELLERLGIREESRYRSSHDRMVKAVKNMRHLTDTLLWVCRESETPLPSETLQLDRFLIELVDESVYLLTGKDISLRTDLKPQRLRAPRTIAHIVFSNIIRNAFQHTCEGIISLSIGDGFVEVINDAEIKRSQKCMDCHGLGLHLSIQLAQKEGWDMVVDDSPGKFRVRITFDTYPETGAAVSSQTN